MFLSFSGAKQKTTTSISVSSGQCHAQNIQKRKYSPTDVRLLPQMKAMIGICLSVPCAMESGPNIQKHLRNVLLLYFCHGKEYCSSNQVQVYNFCVLQFYMVLENKFSFLHLTVSDQTHKVRWDHAVVEVIRVLNETH